jgi:signal transduction histidine kinase
LREFTAAAPPPLQSADFATDSSGTISQAEQHTAPMLIGVNLAEYPHLAGQIRQHQPIRHTAIALTGGAAISGDWIIDAAPQFDRHAGHFTGYLGRLRRLAPPATTPQSAESPSTDSQSDRLRQILHELRTPVNAIQGFAEIIQQQLFGPAPHEYRALAANIASDAARMMAGFDELDRLARLDSGTQDSAIGSCDLGDCVAASVARLQHHGAKIHVTNTDADLTITMPPIEAERLIWRLLGTLNSRAEPDECLHITLSQNQNMAHIAHQIPAALAACDDETLFHTAPNIVQNTLASGLFGGGFALRLATAEAKAAGGQLRRDKGIFNLFLPMVNPANSADLTPSPAQNSNDKTGETTHIA